MSENLTEVLMPLMGEGINEAILVKWLKKPGEKIAKSEPLLEVSTDKVDTEIPAPTDGILVATFADAGATVPINTVIAHIGVSGASGSVEATNVKNTTSVSGISTQQSKTTTAPSKIAVPSRSAQTIPTPARENGANTGPVATIAPIDGQRTSPLVRKMAQEHHVRLTDVVGSGMGGRITKDDLLAHMAQNPVPTIATPTVGAPTVKTTSKRLQTTTVDGKEILDGVPIRREKMSKIRRLTAEHMVESVQVSPHVTTVFEIDLEKVVNIREKEKAAFEKREGFKLTYTPFLLHAAVSAIKRHPIVNVSVDGDEILFKDDINIGCAVAIESGLIVPVVKKANNLSLREVACKLNDLVTRARSKKLLPEDVQGGTFSVTNPGGFGSLTSNPIINQPQVAMLGIGAIVKRPVVIDDKIVIRPMILISLTFDHRVVDGEGGAKYLASLKEILEGYESLPK